MVLALPNVTATKTISSVSEAINHFQDLAGQYPEDTILFRGHAKHDWPVTPSIFRQSPDIKQFESQIIRELISAFPSAFSDDRTMFDRLVRMQHFGLPTRLLDASRNPLVALYFACDPEYSGDDDGAIISFRSPTSRVKFYDSDVVSCMANLANLSMEEKDSIEASSAVSIADLARIEAVKRLVQFIKEEKPYFLPQIKKVDLFKPISVIPKMSNARLSAQNGAFVLFGLDRSKGVAYHKDSTVMKVRIPLTSKEEILSTLSSLGIDGFTLFPEIDRAAKIIKQRYMRKVPA